MNDQWPISFLTSVILLLILVSSSFAQTTISQNLIEFKHKDKMIRNLPLVELERYLTKQTLKIFEVHEKKERTYQVYSATVSISIENCPVISVENCSPCLIG